MRMFTRALDKESQFSMYSWKASPDTNYMNRIVLLPFPNTAECFVESSIFRRGVCQTVLKLWQMLHLEKEHLDQYERGKEGGLFFFFFEESASFQCPFFVWYSVLLDNLILKPKAYWFTMAWNGWTQWGDKAFVSCQLLNIKWYWELSNLFIICTAKCILETI